MYLTETGGAIDKTAITTIIARLLDLASDILTFISSNPMLMIMFGGSLVGVACYVVSKVKKTAKV